MKKFIALLLSLILVVCLTACGKLSAEGQKVSAMLTGQDSKTVKLTLKGEVISGAEKIVSVPADDGGATFAKAEITKDTEKKTVIRFTGLEPGGGIVNVECKAGSETVCKVSFLLTYFETGKFSFGALQIDEGEFLDFETSGDNKEEAAENVLIPNTGSNDTGLIFIKQADGEWMADEYDADIVDPVYFGVSEDGYAKFQVIPVAAGESNVQFINFKLMKKVFAKYEVIENPAAEGEEKTYSAMLKDYVFQDYTTEEYINRLGLAAEERKIQLFDPSFSIPKDCIIRNFSLYNFKEVDKDKTKSDTFFSFEEGTVLEGVKIPEKIDTASVELKYKDLTLGYEITKGRTKKAICKSIESLKATESTEEITIGETVITYYHTTYGFGQAVWEDGEFVRSITFIGENQTPAGNKEILKDFVR